MSDASEARSRGKHKFTPEEDRIIKEYVALHGMRDWNNVAMMLPQRTGKQVRERYINYLNPDVSLKPWTQDEEKLLIDLVNKYGKRWSKFVFHFQNRTDIAIKNHWVNICRSFKKGNTIPSLICQIDSSPEEIKGPLKVSAQFDLNQRYKADLEEFTFEISNKGIPEVVTPRDEPLLWEDIFSEGCSEYAWINTSELLI